MADNVSITPGTGAVIATDEVTDGVLGTVQVQMFKLMDGTLNSTNKSVIDSSGRLAVKPILDVMTGNAPAAASVGVTSAQVLASNTSRKGAMFINTSANVISLAFGATAVLGSGITLEPNGSFTMDAYSFTTQAVNAIAGVAASNLSIQEMQ